MSFQASWQLEYKAEIEHAVRAREAGNAGMARVCARRAAGVIIGEYLHRQGFHNLSHSAYDRISLFSSLPDVDPRCKEIARHLLLKVNTNYTLPLDADLVGEAMWLEKTLLNSPTN